MSDDPRVPYYDPQDDIWYYFASVDERDRWIANRHSPVITSTNNGENDD